MMNSSYNIKLKFNWKEKWHIIWIFLFALCNSIKLSKLLDNKRTTASYLSVHKRHLFLQSQHHSSLNIEKKFVMRKNSKDITRDYEKMFSTLMRIADDNNIIFDKEKTFYPSSEENIVDKNSFHDLLLPIYMTISQDFINDFVNDMNELFLYMKSFQTSEDKIVCRLAVIKGVRCPKWHEDNIKIRLIKSYYGSGTDWTNPNDYLVRFNNFIRSLLNLDLIVEESKINHCNTGDILIIPGKKNINELPVLHRSPVSNNINEQRLLFTITVTPM